VLHHLLTGEQEGYYREFVEQPTAKLARFLGEGFVFQGEPDRRGRLRGAPSGHLPPTSFILFLQNHDQVGNRALGERLNHLADPEALRAALVLVLLSPMVPLLFMGEEWGASEPFLYFTDHSPALAKAVCEGRRNEFADFARFADPQLRAQIPDPNAQDSFLRSTPAYGAPHSEQQQQWLALYRSLLHLRTEEIIPRLSGGAQSAGVTILAEGAVSACWQLGDQTLLRIDLNLSATPVAAPPLSAAEGERVLFQQGIDEQALAQGVLPARTAIASLKE
jgi:maltooligosyltrehalose trehalohydrolase